MYGLLLENLAEYIKVGYGEDMWETVRREAMVDVPAFCTHQVYPESMIPRLAKAACKVSAPRPRGVFCARPVNFYTAAAAVYQLPAVILELATMDVR